MDQARAHGVVRDPVDQDEAAGVPVLQVRVEGDRLGELDLGHPDLDWVGLARSMGVPGARVTTMDAFNDRFAEGIATPGPFLVEVVL